MKKIRNLIICLAVLLVMCIGIFAAKHYEQKKEEIANSGETILAVSSNDISKVSWNTEEDEFSLHKDSGWIYDADENFPVDEDKIDDMLAQFDDFRAAFVIDNVEDLSQYGLDDPECVINFTAGEQEYTVSLGDFSTMDSERYVSIEDGRVYLVSHDPLEDFDVQLEDLIRNDEIPYWDQVAQISFSGAENYSITYDEDNTNTSNSEDVYFTDNKPLDTDNVVDYLSAIQSVALSEYSTYNATEEELEEYGLKDPCLTITLDYSSEEQNENAADEASDEASDESGDDTGKLVLYIGRNQEELAAAQAREADQDSSNGDSSDRASDYDGEDYDTEDDPESDVTDYIRIGDSPIVYILSSDSYEALAACAYNDLRHQDLVSVTMDDVYQMDVELDGSTYTFTGESGTDMTEWKYQEESVDLSLVSSYLKALTADSFTEETPEGQEEIKVTLHLHNDNYPTLEYTLYRKDGDTCIAQTSGVTQCLVPRSQVVNLMEAVRDLVL